MANVRLGCDLSTGRTGGRQQCRTSQKDFHQRRPDSSPRLLEPKCTRLTTAISKKLFCVCVCLCLFARGACSVQSSCVTRIRLWHPTNTFGISILEFEPVMVRQPLDSPCSNLKLHWRRLVEALKDLWCVRIDTGVVALELREARRWHAVRDYPWTHGG